MKPDTILKQLGYSPNEVKIYLASLKFGPGNVTDLAEEIEMPRSTVKELVVEMHKRGLMNYYMRRSHKIWYAENPDKLLVDFKEREAMLAGAIPVLKSMSMDSSLTPKVKIFVGPQEIKMIMEDIITTRKNISAIVSWDDWISLLGHDYVWDFIDRRAHYNLHIKLLTPRTATANTLKLRDNYQARQTRFLPSSINFGTSNFFYGNKVALISLNSKSAVGVVIEDKDVAATMDIFFESLWSQSE